ncbi:hypothetical protein BSKO_03063 [Bryopsis sp. KO-2023]|nr:hypothetical protein BSKO_03063 [Bryopsis sp. KO-2023]
MRGSRNTQGQATVLGVSPVASVSGGPSHQVEEYWTAAVKGTSLLKFGRRGSPHMHFFRLSEDNCALQWESRNGRVRRVPLSSVHKVVQGQQTDVFIKSRSRQTRSMADLSFSLLYRHRSEERTLDLVCKDQEEFDLWCNGLSLIAEHIRKEGRGGGMVIGIADQMYGTPAPKTTPPGDCYIWGSLPSEPNNGCKEPQIPITAPQLVPSAQKLDIVQVACGPQHFAAVTRSGHLYTWGTGDSGRLGLGTLQHVATPTAVYGLNDMACVKYASCGDCSTAAILGDGSLSTWGGGLSGQLGHDNMITQYLPRRVERGLYGVKIVEVSCGPYHTAASSEDGQLYTWGDGLCGKLGHGDWQSSLVPRPVQSLVMEGRVSAVSCGWWHTAAVLDLAVPTNSITSSLYTWGGEFTWKKDNNKGCLGTGSAEGSSLPKRVEGDLGLRNVKQVACGLNLTVALTMDGLIYQMGATGAEDTHMPWESAKNPTRVEGNLKGCFADRVACGRQHVCVVATPIQSGRIDEARRSTYLFTWGSGKSGQLGNGDKKDHSSPQIVEALRQRRIEDISCGGDYTLAVCRYDPSFAAAAFVWNPDPAALPTSNSTLTRKSNTAAHQSSSAFPFSLGPFKQKSVRHTRNQGSSLGSDVNIPKPPPKVIGVHMKTRVRLERQKITETPWLAPFMPSQRPPNYSPRGPPTENGEGSRNGDNSSVNSERPSPSGVISRRDTAPAYVGRAFAGEEAGTNHRGHLISADTAYQQGAQYLDSGGFDEALPDDGRSLESSELQRTQDFDGGESVTSGVFSDPTHSVRDMSARFREMDRSSTDGSLATTEGINRSHIDSDDDGTVESRSHTRSSSQVDLRGDDDGGLNQSPTAFYEDRDGQGGSTPGPDGQYTNLPVPPATGPSWPRSQQLRSAARLRSRQKVLQEVLSLSESWTAPERHASTSAIPHVSELPRPPRLWESNENSIAEGAAEDSAPDIAGAGSRAAVDEGQPGPSTSSNTGIAHSSATHILEHPETARPPTSRQVMQLPGHSARTRPDGLPRLNLDRGSSVPVMSFPLATAREEVMSKAAEYELWRQQLQKYLETLQVTQAKLNDVAEEQGKEAGELGVEIGNIKDTLKTMPAVRGSGIVPTAIANPSPQNSDGAQSAPIQPKVMDDVKKLAELLVNSSVAFKVSDSEAGTDDKLASENMQLKQLLGSLSSVVDGLAGTLKIPKPAAPLVAASEPPAESEPKEKTEEVTEEEKAEEVPGEAEPEAEPEPVVEPEAEAEAVIEPVAGPGRGAEPAPGHKRIRSLDLARNAGNASGPSGQSNTNMNMWMDQVDTGVSVIFQSTQNVTKIKKIRFSKRMFTADRAQQWWQENQSRLVHQYGLVPGSGPGEQGPVRSTAASESVPNRAPADMLSLVTASGGGREGQSRELGENGAAPGGVSSVRSHHQPQQESQAQQHNNQLGEGADPAVDDWDSP